MIAFIEEHRNDLGVEPVCKVLPIAQSTFYAHQAITKKPDLASDRAKRDVDMSPEIKRVWEENNEVYGIRKVWHQLQREKFTIARCTVAKLMKHLDIQGVIRGKVQKTTVPDKSQPCPKDKVNRNFRAPAPNTLWVSDFTYVSTAAQQSLLAAMRGGQGFVYVAFIIDTFADKIVGWRVSSSPKTDFVLDALEQALHDRRPVHKGGLIHHSDRGGQYLSIRYTERLALAGIEPSVGSVGDSYDNAPLGRFVSQIACQAMLGRNHKWPLQSRSNPPAWPMENHGSGRVGNAQMGRLVQQSSSACPNRIHPTSRSRREVLCTAQHVRYGRMRRSNQPPANWGRFIMEASIQFDPSVTLAKAELVSSQADEEDISVAFREHARSRPKQSSRHIWRSS